MINTIRTARSRTSGANLFVVLLIVAPSTQELEPPANPGRFTTTSAITCSERLNALDSSDVQKVEIFANAGDLHPQTGLLMNLVARLKSPSAAFIALQRRGSIFIQ
jgi:hypothetical protein